MKSYRLLLLDDNGRILGSRAIECATDREAIEMAEKDNGPFALIEIWRGRDPVCVCAKPKGALRFRLAPSPRS
jgi:hypothetical protein